MKNKNHDIKFSDAIYFMLTIYIKNGKTIMLIFVAKSDKIY